MFLSILSMFMSSCSDPSYLDVGDVDDVKDECYEDRYFERGDILDEIVGCWELIYIDCGFCIPFGDVEAGVDLNDDGTGRLEYFERLESGNIEENVDFTWNIVESTDIFGSTTWLLYTEPSHFVLQQEVFCSQYMFFDNTPVDGVQVIFERE